MTGNSESVPATRATFQTGQVATIVGAHFVHDTYSAFLAPLLPILQERLNTSYALTGGLAIFPQLASLLNPFIGYAADRISLRYFIILAPGVTATLMGMLGLVPSYAALALLLVATGLSVAAFHAPAPAMVARVSGNQVGKGMSIFMAGGELGRTLGPLVVVGGVTWFGLEGLWRLSAAGWLVSIVLYLRMRHISARPAAAKHVSPIQAWNQGRSFFLVMLGVLLARVFITAPITTYLPLFLTDVVGTSVELSAVSLTILEGAGVAGVLTAGTLSDRWGRLRMLSLLMVLAPVLLLMFVVAPTWMAVPLLIAMGFTGLAPTPVLLALVQDQFPDNRALANGTFLGMNFVARALAIWLVGILADLIGLDNAFLVSALLALLGLLAVFQLSRVITTTAIKES